ncbi:uncharacterized protein LOC121080689 [Falco naumanni]|uniref:uncharacterized protein LOC121080689 n=1 Tax=Falco naumanni TaxID=148594 RepID=UPI001ADE6068|nr:uncharacterized protein LOC121080689 [Falco naumanni]
MPIILMDPILQAKEILLPHALLTGTAGYRGCGSQPVSPASPPSRERPLTGRRPLLGGAAAAAGSPHGGLHFPACPAAEPALSPCRRCTPTPCGALATWQVDGGRRQCPRGARLGVGSRWRGAGPLRGTGWAAPWRELSRFGGLRRPYWSLPAERHCGAVPLASADLKLLEEATISVCKSLVEKNPQTGNLGSLIKVFLSRTKEFKISAECQNHLFIWQAHNALFIICCLLKVFISRMSEEELQLHFTYE